MGYEYYKITPANTEFRSCSTIMSRNTKGGSVLQQNLETLTSFLYRPVVTRLVGASPLTMVFSFRAYRPNGIKFDFNTLTNK